jgi:deoxyribonuclease V
MQLMDQATAELPTPFPYIPGLLSFREIPVILAALEKLQTTPDVLMTDGHGMAHPRRFGLACHLGVLLDLPTIGCAKSVFVGEHETLPEAQGSTKPLMDGAETIGMAMRTRDKVKPIYVSIGQYVDLSSAVRVVLACGVGYRLPGPIRWADRLASDTG